MSKKDCDHKWSPTSWGGMDRYKCEKCGAKGEVDNNYDIIAVDDWAIKHYLFGFIPLD